MQIRKSSRLFIGVLAGVACLAASPCDLPAATWKAGTARAVITPKESMWMAGYGARNHPSEGTIHDLWAKAIALQDPAGRKAVMITLDLCGIGRDLSTSVRDTIGRKHGLERDQVVLSCSHTHSGPVVGTNLLTMYRLDDIQRSKIRDYARFLESTLVELARLAIEGLENARISWETGRCDFAVNRRNNKEKDVPELRRKMALAGPVDHDVPVLKISSFDDKPRAVIFTYACHCTVLDSYKFCGDYAGFAQIELERRYPGCQAMFVAGCGADQNPLPRRDVALAEAYGKRLAESVALVLDRPMRVVEGPLRSAYVEIDLKFGALPSKEQIEKDSKSGDFYIASRAKHLLARIAEYDKLAQTYPYPIQAWALDDLDWVFLGGEVTVDYALRIKRNLGDSHTWISAYCNDVMAYIPSLRVLKEGGYEGALSMIYYGQPTVWAEGIEEDIIAGVNQVLEMVNSAGANSTPRSARPDGGSGR